MNIVTRKLIAKELYVNRWFIVVGAAAGVASTLIATLRAEYVDQKRTDALELIEALRSMPAERRAPPQGWKFNTTSLWAKMLSQLLDSDEKADV